MFKQLTNFGYQRDWKEAIGFYIAYLVLTMVLGSLIAGIGSLTFFPSSPNASFEHGFDIGVRIGTGVAVVVSIALALLVLKRKNLLNNIGFIILALLAGILAFFGGGLVGLIPAAYFTTKAAGRAKQ